MKVYVLTHDPNGEWFVYGGVFSTLEAAKRKAQEVTVTEDHALISDWWEGEALSGDHFWQMDTQPDENRLASWTNHFRIYETEVLTEKAEA